MTAQARLKSGQDFLEERGCYLKSYFHENAKFHLLCVHDLTHYHGAFFEFVSQCLPPIACNIALADLKGHGLSSGHRNYIDNFDTYVEDLCQIVGHIKRSCSLPIFLLGEGLGGLAILSGLTANEKNLLWQCKGSIILDPMIGLNSGQWVEKMEKFPESFKNFFPQSRVPVKWEFHRDHQRGKWAKQYPGDPLSHKFVTVKLADEIARAQADLCQRGNIYDFPTLFLLARENAILDLSATQNFLKSIKSTKITVKEYDGVGHGMLNSNKLDELIGDIYRWIEAQ